MAGDSRITDTYHDNMEGLLQKLAGGDNSKSDQHCRLFLPKHPGPLEQLNGRTLKTMVIAIAKDLKIQWDSERPVFWPTHRPFVNPCNAPKNY